MPITRATIPQQTFMIYQLMFAIITPALISGAFAERMKFTAMLLFMMLWALLVYFPMAHMVWGKGGLLNASLGGQVPVLRFRRRHGGAHHFGRFGAGVRAVSGQAQRDIRTEPMSPHSLVLSSIGACLLWVGWFGFNAGSALAAVVAGHQRFRRHAFRRGRGGAGWMVAEWMHNGKPSVLGGDFRGGGGTGGDHAGVGFRQADAGDADRLGRGRGVLLDGQRGQTASSATTIRWTRSACTARAERWARFSPAFSPPRRSTTCRMGKPMGLVDGNAGQVLNQADRRR